MRHSSLALDKGAGGLSASTAAWLKHAWSDAHALEQAQPTAKRCIYFRVDGIHVEARLADRGLVSAEQMQTETSFRGARQFPL